MVNLFDAMKEGLRLERLLSDDQRAKLAAIALEKEPEMSPDFMLESVITAMAVRNLKPRPTGVKKPYRTADDVFRDASQLLASPVAFDAVVREAKEDCGLLRGELGR